MSAIESFLIEAILYELFRRLISNIFTPFRRKAHYITTPEAHQHSWEGAQWISKNIHSTGTVRFYHNSSAKKPLEAMITSQYICDRFVGW